MSIRQGDWIDIVEASYDLNGTTAEWLDGIVSAVAREQWVDKQMFGFIFHMKPKAFDIEATSGSGDPIIMEIASKLNAAISPDLAKHLLLNQDVLTISEIGLDKFPRHKSLYKKFGSQVAPDLLGIVAHDGASRGVVLSLVLDAVRRSTAVERRRWRRCAAHIGAGLRLRTNLGGLSILDAPAIEGIFDSCGKVMDARGPVEQADVREQLRAAIVKVDRSRGRLRDDDPDAALATWEGLVDGRWSILDHFDTDGRRYVVAVRNDPRFKDPRGLSERERQVAEYVGLGQPVKQIAYTLGVGSSAIENAIRRIQRKLQMYSRAELAAFFSPFRTLSQIDVFDVPDQKIRGLILDHPSGPEEFDLTISERDILSFIVSGSTNKDIAIRRQTSVHTIANQVQSIFRKFRVRSRGELVARLYQT